MPTKTKPSKKELLALIEEHKCEIHLRPHTEALFMATYTYDWTEDASCKFTLLSEVAESLIDAFFLIMKQRGLEQAGSRHTTNKPYVQDLLTPDPESPAGRRWLKLMPGGEPRWVRVYDNGGADAGGSIDQYTVVFTGRAPVMKGGPGQANQYPYLAMNCAPFHPQGFGQHGHTNHSPCDTPNGTWPPALGRKNHLGTRIKFSDLPYDCRRCVINDYLAIWRL